MKLNRPDADLYIPDALPESEALTRTTHLGIGAHQDDLEIFSYSAIAECHRNPDLWYTGVVVTDGGGSSRTGPYRDFTDEQMKAERCREQREAAKLGGYAAQLQLAYPSTVVKNPAEGGVVDDLETVLRATRPETVYLHNPADKHDTHVAVLARCLSALRRLSPAERPKKVYGCEVWRDLDWLLDSDKQVLDAGANPELASDLVGVFQSQISGGKRYDLAALGRRLAHATFFESHASDKSQALIWAMDLTPLIQESGPGLAEFTAAYIDRFRSDVLRRIEKFA